MLLWGRPLLSLALAVVVVVPWVVSPPHPGLVGLAIARRHCGPGLLLVVVSERYLCVLELVGLLVRPYRVSDHLAEGPQARVTAVQKVLHGPDVVDGHVKDVDLGQLLAFSSTGQDRVGDLVTELLEGVVYLSHPLPLPEVGRLAPVLGHGD